MRKLLFPSKGSQCSRGQAVGDPWSLSKNQEMCEVRERGWAEELDRRGEEGEERALQ